jgi:hypothetical protein
VADGPRTEEEGEAERCAAARKIAEDVDWPCELLTEYSEVNLGTGERIWIGLDWVFGTVKEAIVLEGRLSAPSLLLPLLRGAAGALARGYPGDAHQRR